MGQTVTFPVNDINQEIEGVIDTLCALEGVKVDAVVKAIILTKLKEAQLWSLKLIKS
jgi:hypothetical protein